jgi:hypothetical protein
MHPEARHRVLDFIVPGLLRGEHEIRRRGEREKLEREPRERAIERLRAAAGSRSDDLWLERVSIAQPSRGSTQRPRDFP